MNDFSYSLVRQLLGLLTGFVVFYLIDPYNFIIKTLICTVFYWLFYYVLDKGYKKWKKRYKK